MFQDFACWRLETAQIFAYKYIYNPPPSCGVGLAVSSGFGWLLLASIVLSFITFLVFWYLKPKSFQNEFEKEGPMGEEIKKVIDETLVQIKIIVQNFVFAIAISELSARPHGLPIFIFEDSAISLKSEVLRRIPVPYINGRKNRANETTRIALTFLDNP